MHVTGSPTPSSTHTRYDTLDGMRGVAAICVMLYHFTEGRWSLSNAPLAVDLFFILSGFVIVHSYGSRVKSGAMSALGYLGRRLVRLYPMFLLGLIIGTPFLYMSQSLGYLDSPRSFIAKSLFLNAFYLPCFNPYGIRNFDYLSHTTGPIFPANSPAWSLFFEIVASAAFLLFVRLGRKALVATVILSYLAFIACGIAHAFLDHRHAVDLELGWGTDNFYGGFPRVIYGFTFGMLLYHVVNDPKFQRLRVTATRYVKNSYLLYLVLVLIFLFPKQFFGLYPAFVVSIAAPCLVYLGSIVTCTTAASSNIARFLGWISYPIYCLHLPIDSTVTLLMGRAHYPLSLILLVSLTITITAAILLTRFYDEPVRAYFTRKLSGKSKANA